MINTLLTKIAGLLEREFLFASFLPGLLFTFSLGVAGLAVVGGESAWAGVASYDAVQKSAGGVAGILALIVFSYVLHALRPAFLDFWSGRLAWLRWGLVRVGEQRRRWRFHRMRMSADKLPFWRRRLDAFQSEARKVWQESGPMLPENAYADLASALRNLRREGPRETMENVLTGILVTFSAYGGDRVSDLYELVKRRLQGWAAEEEAEIQQETFRLDREFGMQESVRATRLGNVIESYQQYPAKRYRIEAEIFWPRLQKVIEKEYVEILREPRILLDFSVTMSSLAVAYCAFALLVGPWLWYNAKFWALLGITSALAAAFFYQLAVRAAMQLGELIRASFDLFRLDLLRVLRLPEPATYTEEQKIWEQFSKLTVYGAGAEFSIQPRGGTGGSATA